MSEQKIRFALEQCVKLMENDLEGLALLQPELRLAREALAQQTAVVVNLTDAEITKIISSYGYCVTDEDMVSDSLACHRAVIAAHIAKQNA